MDSESVSSNLLDFALPIFQFLFFDEMSRYTDKRQQKGITNNSPNILGGQETNNCLLYYCETSFKLVSVLVLCGLNVEIIVKV